MKTLMLAAAALTLGLSAASAQGVPQGLLDQQLGAPWAAKTLAQQHATRDQMRAAETKATPERTADASAAYAVPHTAKN